MQILHNISAYIAFFIGQQCPAITTYEMESEGKQRAEIIFWFSGAAAH